MSVDGSIFGFDPGIQIVITATEIANDKVKFFVPRNRDVYVCECFGQDLHHSRIEQAWREVLDYSTAHSEAVVLVSTHSTAVIDRVPFGSEEIARRLVRMTKHGPVRLTDKQREQFVDRFDAGIEHVSEILITMGLW